MVDPLPKDPDVCPCGVRLHYPDAPAEQAMRRLVRRYGWWITVKLRDGRAWRVPRHYLALHRLAAEDLPALAAKHEWPQLAAWLAWAVSTLSAWWDG